MTFCLTREIVRVFLSFLLVMLSRRQDMTVTTGNGRPGSDL